MVSRILAATLWVIVIGCSVNALGAPQPKVQPEKAEAPKPMESTQVHFRLPVSEPTVSASDIWPSALGGAMGGTVMGVACNACTTGCNILSMGAIISGFSGGNVGCLLGGMCSFLACALPAHVWSGTIISSGVLAGAAIGQSALTSRRIWPILLGALPGFAVALVGGALSTFITLYGIQQVVGAADGESLLNHVGMAVLGGMVLGLAGPTTFLGTLGANVLFGESLPEESSLSSHLPTETMEDRGGDSHTKLKKTSPSDQPKRLNHVRLRY